MIEYIDVMTEFFIDIFEDMTFKRAAFIIAAYFILHSRTIIGFLLRVLCVYLVYAAFKVYADNGNYLQAIESALELTIIFFWPMIIKYIVRFFKMVFKSPQRGGD